MLRWELGQGLLSDEELEKKLVEEWNDDDQAEELFFAVKSYGM